MRPLRLKQTAGWLAPSGFAFTFAYQALCAGCTCATAGWPCIGCSGGCSMQAPWYLSAWPPYPLLPVARYLSARVLQLCCCCCCGCVFIPLAANIPSPVLTVAMQAFLVAPQLLLYNVDNDIIPRYFGRGPVSGLTATLFVDMLTGTCGLLVPLVSLFTLCTAPVSRQPYHGFLTVACVGFK
jgi:hypothetical protein